MRIISVVILFLLFSCQEAVKQESPWRPDKGLAIQYNDTANTYLNKGEYELALAYYNKAILYDSTCAGYFHNRGNIKYHLKMYQEALEDFTRAIEMESDTLCQNKTESYYSRAMTFSDMKDYNNAIRDYTQAIESDTSNKIYLFYRAEVHLTMGDTASACADWREGCVNWQEVWNKGGEAAMDSLIKYCGE